MKSKEIKILLAAPRGFCAGVERAIEIVKKSINKYGAPVYVRHEIVHNKHVVDGLKKIGAIFVEELDEIKDKTRPVIFSAHGVPKKVPIEAESFKMEYVDATCPLVSKVHREAENLNKNGLQILLIGHKNHPEVIGTMGQIPEGEIDLIENVDDANNYENKSKKKLAFVTQTTLSVDDTKEIILALKKKFPEIREPKKEDICYATTNRQAAVKKIAERCDMFFVIGSRNSSNSLRLVEVAKNSGCTNSRLIHSESAVPFEEIEKHKTIGISSGASAPEILVDNFINDLDGITTIGSCQGHDDGGPSTDWFYPYIKFKCTNNHTLAVLATIEHAYLSIDEQAKLSSFDSSLAFEPNLSASWSIEVVSHFEFNEMKNPSEFAMYVLRPESDSYDKASHVYSDFEQILKWYKYQVILRY